MSARWKAADPSVTVKSRRPSPASASQSSVTHSASASAESSPSSSTPACWNSPSWPRCGAHGRMHGAT